MWSISKIAFSVNFIFIAVAGHEFPIFFKTQVSILSGRKLCGGTLIDPKHVVTSVQCIEGYIEQTHIKTIPTISLEVVASGDRHEVDTFRILGLNSKSLNDDPSSRFHAIGFLELVQPVTNRINFDLLKLSEENDDTLFDTEVVIISSDKMKFNEPYKGKRRNLYLTKLPAKITSDSRCRNLDSLKTDESNSSSRLCAITNIQKYEINKGDPVTQNNQLVGVVEKYELGQPIVFTKVSKFISLIRENTNHASNCDRPLCYKVNPSDVTKSLECDEGDDGGRQCLVKL